MIDENRPSAPSSASKRWIVASLALAIAILAGVLFHGRPRRVSAPAPVIQTTVTQLEAVAKPFADMPGAAVDSSGGMEACGHGGVNLGTSDSTANATYLGKLTEDAGTRWRSALLSSDRSRARAVGLLLQGYPTRNDPPGAAAGQSLDDLVQLAAGTRDPAVYAIALRMCNAHSDTEMSGPCQQISVNEWARIDADNAVPWLLLAGSAQMRNDGTAETAAFRRAAEAHKSDSYGSSLYAFAQAELPVDSTPLQRLYLATELIGYEAAWPEPQYRAALKHCPIEAMQDASVRQTCDSLAELFTSKGTTMLDLLVGRRLGERVGWSADRIAALTQEWNALMQSFTSDGGDGPWNCNRVQLRNEFIGEIARLGEVAAAREALEGSGNSVAEAAQRQVDLMEKLKSAALKQQGITPAGSQP